jgi:molecular chaperone GrpE
VTDERHVHDPFAGEETREEAEASVEPDAAVGPTADVDVEEKDELQEARAQAAQYLDDLRRLKAEFENYRKRVVREQTALVDTAASALVEQLLPVLDDFELALIAADRTKDYAALVRGVELVFSKLTEVLHKQGLRKIEAEARPFDPELHEAVMQEEGSGEGKPVVGEVFRSGYTLGGRVIRPAMVKVKREQ